MKFTHRKRRRPSNLKIQKIFFGRLYYNIKMAAKESVTEKAILSSSVIGALRVFSFFSLILGFIMFIIFASILFDILRTQKWSESPCVILSSSVSSSHSHEGGNSYGVRVNYRYQVDGQTYTSNRYAFFTRGDYKKQKTIVDRLVPGSEAICYVNPKNPRKVFLKRSVTSDLLFPLILSLFFMTFSIGCRLLALRLAARRRENLGIEVPVGNPLMRKIQVRPSALSSRASPGKKFIAVTGIAIFWNGMVSIFLHQLFKNYRDQSWDLFGMFFLFMIIPFVLLGLVLVGGIVYFLLALFNPRPVLRMSCRSVSLGDSVNLEWETSGGVGRFQSFKITLEGHEKVRVMRGKDNTYHQRVFTTRVVKESMNKEDMQRGMATVLIPADTMHSWASENNEISWILRVLGRIPGWPDINEEFLLEVLPA